VVVEEVAVSGSSFRAARLALPLVAAGLLAAACGATPGDRAAGGSGSSPAGSASAPVTTASGLPAPSGIPVPSAPTSGGPPGPGAGVRQLGPADNGKTVTLEVGQLLSIQLPSDRLAAGRWRLVGWPKDAVTPKLTNSGLGRFAFQAQATGGGRITFARFVCNTALSNPCAGIPLPGPKFAPEPPSGRPAGFSVIVQVV
jgi:hypothetical protein